MFLYDSKILNPNLAPDWFTIVKVIEITPDPGVSGTGHLYRYLSSCSCQPLSSKVTAMISSHLLAS